MMDFSARFTSYASGRREISREWTFRSENFDTAVRDANLVLTGMRAGDPDTDYQIVSIASRAYHGEPLKGDGPQGIWGPTYEEAEAARD